MLRPGLKFAIINSGRSQRAIAASIGMSEPRLSRIVRCCVDPTLTEKQALMQCLGVTLDAFEPDREGRNYLALLANGYMLREPPEEDE
jgi:hypothetical protein